MLSLIKVPRETLKVWNPQNLLSPRQEKTNPQHQQACRAVWSEIIQPKIKERKQRNQRLTKDHTLFSFGGNINGS